MKKNPSMEIALKRAYDHLPIFEGHHTDAGWARSLLVWIASYGAAPANLPIVMDACIKVEHQRLLG